MSPLGKFECVLVTSLIGLAAARSADGALAALTLLFILEIMKAM